MDSGPWTMDGGQWTGRIGQSLGMCFILWQLIKGSVLCVLHTQIDTTCVCLYGRGKHFIADACLDFALLLVLI